jgi:hypothetical protein
MEYPFLRRRDRGSGTGRAEIVFSEEQGWEEAQAFAARVVARLGLAVSRRVDGPDAWLWDVQGAGGSFILGYDDFPCETTLWAADPGSDAAVERLFSKLVGGAPDAEPGAELDRLTSSLEGSMTLHRRHLPVALSFGVVLGIGLTLAQWRRACRVPASEACVWGRAYLPISLPLGAAAGLVVAAVAFVVSTFIFSSGARQVDRRR